MMAAAGRPQILVLEDEWLIADQIASTLRGAGYGVLGPVGRIDDAMVLVGQEHVDAALLDINLHNDRSYRLAEELCRRSVLFAFVSGYSADDLPARFVGRPMMQKPIDPPALRRCVGSLLPVA